jgi:hypothetical protein
MVTTIQVYDIATKTRNGEPGGFPMIKLPAPVDGKVSLANVTF